MAGRSTMHVSMGKDILFRWDDPERLKHHCGFCNRPLSHPGARSSCFGIHAEPCHRFHQAMFMRGRGHTCDMCSHTEEAHHKRHHQLCEQIRAIYECNDEEWPIIPDDEADRGRSRPRGSGLIEGGHPSSMSFDVPLTKREKKEQKKQIRAASRAKVITLEDINYVDSVLHPATSRDGCTKDPNNPDEVEEIEQHLKYNAKCYNEGVKRSDLRKFAHIPDADIDFGAEIDRVFDVFRITELLKRSHRNRGLRNKELANFKALVEEFRDKIIHDLVAAKRDEMETRMRRAAFLRYTNRASYDIVTTRYAEKDWKTGEKFRSPAGGSTSSGSLTAAEEEYEDDYVAELKSPSVKDADRRHLQLTHVKIGGNGVVEEPSAVLAQNAPAKSTPKGPLSLRITNTNVTMPQEVKFRDPWKKPKNTLTHLKRESQLLSSEELPSKRPVLDSDEGWYTIGRSHHVLEQLPPIEPLKYPWPALKPSRVGVIAQLAPAEEERRRKITAQRDAERGGRPQHENIDLRKEIGNAQVMNDYITSDSPERTFAEALLSSPLQKVGKTTKHAHDSHAPVESRKKKDKKQQREAERKARRATENTSVQVSKTESVAPGRIGRVSVILGDTKEDIPNSEAVIPDGVPLREGLEGTDDSFYPPRNDLMAETGYTGNEDRTTTVKFSTLIPESVAKAKGLGRALDPSYNMPETIKPMKENVTDGITCDPSQSTIPAAPIPTSKIGRHNDWIKYAGSTLVDGLSEPWFVSHPAYYSHAGCLSNSGCLFETSRTPDCPFHKTYCSCVDPLNRDNDKYIVYPSHDSCEIGPFNYMQGDKLMRFFDAQPETKGRVMLVDAELYLWLCTEGRRWRYEEIDFDVLDNTPMPERLSWDVEDYMRGYTKGKSLKQVDLYRVLVDRNERWCSRAKVTEELLENLRKKCESATDKEAICYCRGNMPATAEEDLVQCGYRCCPTKLYHRRCVQGLGFNKLSRWYCGFCEKYMSIEAQKAVCEAHAMHLGKPLPSPGEDGYRNNARAIASAMDALAKRHTCGKH